MMDIKQILFPWFINLLITNWLFFCLAYIVRDFRETDLLPGVALKMKISQTKNKGIRFLLHVIDNVSKYPWVITLADKKGTTITNAFQKKLDRSNRKPPKMWVDKGSEFYNRSIKSQFEKNVKEMYSTNNKGISAVAERSIRTLTLKKLEGRSL